MFIIICIFINYMIGRRRRVSFLSFFDYLSPFCFLIEFHCTFSISYKMLQFFVYYYYSFWLGCDMPSGLPFFRACFASFLYSPSLLTFFCFFVLFHSGFSHGWVFGKTLVHEFHISYMAISILNGTCFFRECNYIQVHILRTDQKSINT